MEKKGILTSNFERGRKLIVGGLISALAVVMCTLVLSVTAFAGDAGESVFENLFNNFNNPALADYNGTDSYQYGSAIISDSAEGEDFDENATYRTVTVHFTNNYVSDAARIELAEPQVLVYKEGKAFNFEVALTDSAMGAPRKITLDESLDLSYVVSNDNNNVLFTSENGITKDTDIDVRYGNEVEAYKILRFYQGSDGDWRDDAITEDKIGQTYSTIPSEQEIQDGLTNHPGFKLDTYDNGVVLPGITSMVSIYYARLVNTVVFDDNGGANGPGTIFARSGNVYNLNNSTPTRAGYDFKGWWTEKEGGEQLPESQYSNYAIPSDATTTYYAHWELQDTHIVTVVYWGENANDTNYSFISEAYFSASKEEVGSDFTLADTSYGYAPRTGANKTLVEQYDTDGNGQVDHAMTECFNTTEGVVAPSVKIEPGQYTVYNVYLKRVQYTWEYYTNVSITGYKSRSQEVTWTHSGLIDKIVAKWGQDISVQYKAICEKAYGKGATSGRWLSGVNPEYVALYEYYSLSDIGYFKCYVSNMELVNRVSGNKGLDNAAFGKFNVDDKAFWQYYCQKINAGDAHSTPEEIAANYDLVTTITCSENSNFTDDEWINIDGFITPSKDDGLDAPTLFVPGSETEHTAIDGQGFFYKRVKSPLYLYYAKSGLGPTETSDTYFRKIGDFDYEATLADVPVPENMPGTLKDTSKGRTLGNFIPENPEVSGLDSNYVFAGWGLSPTSSETIDLSSSKMPDKTYSLYAKWVVPTQAVTFYQVSKAKTEDIASSVVLENQTYNKKIDGEIPVPTEFPNFYFLYWYYYADEAAQEAGQRTYFDPLNSPVPAKDIELFPEYSSTEPNTEYLVSPVNKPDQFHGSISPDDYFYVKNGEKFTKADEDALEIMDMDGKTLHSITATPADGYRFKEWQLTYGGAEDYDKITAGETAVENVCGVKAVFESTGQEEAVVVTPPKPIDELQYNGEPQVIATDGVAENGTMQYIVNQSSTSEEGTWSDTIDKKTEVGTYYVHFYAKGDEGYLDSAHGTIQCKIDKADYTVYVYGNDVTKQFTGSAIRLSGADCVNFECEDFPGGIDPEDFSIDENLYVEGTDVGVYETAKELDEYTYEYTGEYADFVNITYEKTQPTVTVLRIVEKPEPVAIPVPIWNEDIVYDGQNHDISIQPDVARWTNYDSEKMVLDRQTMGKDPGSYTAEFTVNEGFVWEGMDPTVKTVEVEWTIVPAQVVVPTWKADITYDGNEHNVSDESYWNNFNILAMTIGGTVTGTDADTYTATFTLNDGYVWQGQEADVRTANVNWKIVSGQPKEDNPFTFNPEHPWVLENDSILVKLENVGDNPTTIGWEIASGDNIEFEVTLGKMAVINGKSASETDAVISVTTSETENYKETTKTCPVKVTAKEEQNVVVTVTEGLYVDEFGMIQVTGIQEKPDMTWEHESGDECIDFVSVTSTYVVNFQGVAGGTETVKLVLAETEHFAETVIYVDVTILPKVVDELSFAKDSYEVCTGGYIDITVDGLSAERTNYSWEVVEGDGNIALSYTKNNPVRVNGLAEGTAKIKITAQGSIKYTEVSAETTVVVTGKPSQSIVFDKQSLTLVKGTTGTVTVSGLLQKPDISWTLSDDTALSIEGATDQATVTLKGNEIGNATLTINVAETSSYAETEASIEVNVVNGEKVYLANRTGSDSIIKPYSDATSVKFVNTIPTDFSDSIAIDINHEGLIKAYKIYDPDNVTYRVEIASNHPMASSATSLAGIFKYFKNLEEIDLTILDVSEATSVQSMFYCCSAIKEIDLRTDNNEGFRAANVTSFLSMFEGCTSVTTIQFGENIVFGNNIDVGKMFRNCPSLTYIVVPVGTDLSGNAGNSSYMFEKCTNLPGFSDKAIDKQRAYAGLKSGVLGYFVTSKDTGTSYLANRDMVSAKSILGDYQDAVSVEFKSNDSTEYSEDYINVDIENKGEIKAYKVPCDGGYKVIVACFQNIASSAKSFEGIFKNFKKLESVDFGNVNMAGATSLKSMFYCASAIKIIQVTSTSNTGFNTSNVTDFSSMFEGCKNAKSIYLDDHFVVNNEATLFQMFRNCNILENIFVVEGTDWSGNTSNTTRMFDACLMLKNFVTESTNNERAFVGAKGEMLGYFTLKPVGQISYLKNRTETNVGVLAGLEGATSVTFSGLDETPYSDDFVNVDIENVGKIKAYKLADGSGYKVIVASKDNIAASPKSLEGIFKGFTNMTSVNFGNIIVDNATSLKSMFYGCKTIKEINFASTAASGFNTSGVTTFRSMVEWCPELEKVTIGNDFVVSPSADKGHMFMLCPKLTEINVPAGTDWSGGTGADELMFESSTHLPNFSALVVDSTRAYVGNKDGVRGYFNNPDTPTTVYLANRSGTSSIIESYNEAVSVTFSSNDTTDYGSDFINVDLNNTGDIKAYKISEGSGYKVVIASKDTIACSPTSFAGIFKNFKKLTTVNFGDINTYEAVSLQSMFYCCTALTSIEMVSSDSAGFNTQGVNNFNSMFESCSSLTRVKLGTGFVVSETASLKQMFLNDAKLKDIVVPAGTDWTSNIGDSSFMFKGDNLLPGYISTAINNERAFVGTKGDVKGYFISE